MSAALALAPEVEPADPVVDWLDRLLASLADLVTDADPATDAERIDRLAALEKVKAAVGAVQVAEIVRFGRSQVEAQRAAGVHPRRVGRGIADQIGLACKTGPADGVRRLGDARALWFEMPGCLDLLDCRPDLRVGSAPAGYRDQPSRQLHPPPGRRRPGSGRSGRHVPQAGPGARPPAGL